MLHVWCALTMQYLPIQPNLEPKTRPKRLLGSLPLDIALPVCSHFLSRKLGPGFVLLTEVCPLPNLELKIRLKQHLGSLQSSWSKGISETKSKQQSPCSNCMHRPVTSWPTVVSHHRDRTYENKKCPCGTLSKPTMAVTSWAGHMH
jgi:hypothetical protein